MGRQIADDVCSKRGHKIVSLIVGNFLDPVSKQMVAKYWIGCEQCGLPPEKIHNYRPIPKSRREKYGKNSVEQSVAEHGSDMPAVRESSTA